MTKITLIGAGSNFTPGLLRDVMNSSSLSGVELCLMDLNAHILDLNRAVCERMIEAAGSDVELSSTTDRREAIESSDYVITSILVGGPEFCRPDVDIPLKYGIAQTIGDTVGPGGIIKALRTIPPILAIAKDMEDSCPDAWLFNLTNPITYLTIAVREATRIRTMALCHGVQVTVDALSRFMGKQIDAFRVLGVNHCSWLLQLMSSGIDIYPEFRRRLAEDDIPGWPISSLLTRRFRYFPTHTDRHVCEFFPYFLRKETGYGSKYGQELWDTDVWVSSKDERTAMLSSLASGKAPLGDLTRPSGGDIIPVIEAMVEDSGREFVVNQPNAGYAPNLPDEAVVEMNAIVDSKGINPAGICKAPRSLLGIIQYRINLQELVVRSILENDKDLALQALILDPLTRSIEDVEKMFDELLAVNRDYLPDFS
ncbi:MAG: hypothetical protein HXS50_04025 [Theionarchaea archaeon]|nr:hypothetical protein [Theionarchaea archaeon]